jgi:phage baseplate assembly protein W
MFPMRVDHAGSIAMSTGVEELDSAIRMVLITAPGERLMRPNFGCRIWELLFEPINANTIGLMAVAVREALGQWEPRVDVESVTIESLDGADGKVLIHIGYVVKATNDLRNLVFPFYVIPQEDES